MRLTILSAIALAICVALSLPDQSTEARAFTSAQNVDRFPSGRWPPEFCHTDKTGNPSDKPAKEQMLVCDVPLPEGSSQSEQLKMHLVYANQGLWDYEPDLKEAITFVNCVPPPPEGTEGEASVGATDETTGGKVVWQDGKAVCSAKVSGGGIYSLTIDFNKAMMVETTLNSAKGSRQSRRIQCEAKPVPDIIDCVDLR